MYGGAQVPIFAQRLRLGTPRRHDHDITYTPRKFSNCENFPSVDVVSTAVSTERSMSKLYGPRAADRAARSRQRVCDNWLG